MTTINHLNWIRRGTVKTVIGDISTERNMTKSNTEMQTHNFPNPWSLSKTKLKPLCRSVQYFKRPKRLKTECTLSENELRNFGGIHDFHKPTSENYELDSTISTIKNKRRSYERYDYPYKIENFQKIFQNRLESLLSLNQTADLHSHTHIHVCGFIVRFFTEQTARSSSKGTKISIFCTNGQVSSVILQSKWSRNETFSKFMYKHKYLFSTQKRRKEPGVQYREKYRVKWAVVTDGRVHK